MATVLITGANRGIGLGFCKNYLEQGDRVIATCRNPSGAKELQSLQQNSSDLLSIYALDVADHNAIDKLSEELASEAIDILINNAGIYGERASLGNINYQQWQETMWVNTFAPVKMAEAFLPQVSKSSEKKIANITSLMGSIEDNGSGGSYIYRTSKSALNSATKSLAMDLAPKGIQVVVLHPGWVQTDMGGPNARISVEESVDGLMSVIAQLSAETSGSFYGYDGSELPW